MQFYLDDITGVCGMSKPALEHTRSAALFQLLIERQERLKGNKPFPTKNKLRSAAPASYREAVWFTAD